MKNNRKANRSLRIGFIMDAMKKLDYQYDSSIAIMMEAKKRGHKVFYIEPSDLFVRDGALYAETQEVSISSRKRGFLILSQALLNLRTLDIVFNRKDPPFDIAYLYLTHLLELIEPDVFVINSAKGVRKANEKLYILNFPDWIPPTLVTNCPKRIEEFQRDQNTDLIIKPLDQKGGAGIELLRENSRNKSQILKRTTQGGSKWVIVQKFLKANLSNGDKRILLLNGKVIGKFTRIPKQGEFRANLSLGGKSVRARLSLREEALIKAIRPKLASDGLYFVGLDVVDGFLIEVNVTSPAGITEINELEGRRPEIQVVSFLEDRVSNRSA